MKTSEFITEMDCWDGYKKDGTQKGTGKNKGKRVNKCVPAEAVEEVKIDEAEFEITYKNPQFTGTKKHTVKAVNAKGAEQKFLSFGNPHKVLDVTYQQKLLQRLIGLYHKTLYQNL